MGPALAAPRRAGALASELRWLLPGIIALEGLILVAGVPVLGGLRAAGLAAAVAFTLVAFRLPDLAAALVWLAVPFSIEVRVLGMAALYVPSEPMILLALLAWGARALLAEPLSLPRSPLHLPLGVLAGLALLSTLLGASPLAGIKAWTASAWYVAFGYVYFLRAACGPARRGVWVRLAVLTGAAWGLAGTMRIIAGGINARLAYGAMRPFFPEHGTYAAYLGFLLPLPILYALDRKGRARWWYALAALATGLGLVLSFTRAAWLSVVGVIPLACVLWARWRGAARRLLLPAVLSGAVALVILGLGAARPFQEHVESIVSTGDISNLERVNRWMAALAMARDRPLTGVGYGCYEIAYPEYRRKLVVTESALVRMGPHSEPLRLLSEIGVPGLLAALWFLVVLFREGLGVFRRSPDPEARLLALALVAGLGTYVIHGVFNSYLGIDKVTLPFWTGIGAIAALGARERSRAA